MATTLKPIYSLIPRVRLTGTLQAHRFIVKIRNVSTEFLPLCFREKIMVDHRTIALCGISETCNPNLSKAIFCVDVDASRLVRVSLQFFLPSTLAHY